MQRPENSSAGRLFRILAVLWLFPSAGALTILTLAWAHHPKDPGTTRQALGYLTFEQWIGGAILLVQFVFIVLAWRGSRKGGRC